jgi:hypothetical protein
MGCCFFVLKFECPRGGRNEDSSDTGIITIALRNVARMAKTQFTLA